MWCVIPAAGRGSRMGSAASDRPKALLEVGGRPLLAWLVDALGPAITDVCVVVGDAPGAGRRFRETLAPHATRTRLHFAVQPEPRGVGDAILRAGGVVEGAFVVAMGDGYYASPLGPCLEAWKRSGCEGAVLVERRLHGGAEPVGWVEPDGDIVRRIHKSAGPSPGDLRLAGMAVLPEAALSLEVPAPSPATGEIELEQLVTRLVDEGMRFRVLHYPGWRRNVNHPKDVDRIRRRLERRSMRPRRGDDESEASKGSAT